MLVALIADTHGFLDERIAHAISGSDVVIHAGDVGAAAVLAELQGLAGEVVAVRGNNDVPRKWPEGEMPALAELPVQATMDLPGGSLTVVHGDAWRAKDRHRRLRRAFSEARAVVYGHSHRLIVDTTGEPWVLNPGAAGRARTYGGPSCLLLEISKRDWQVIPRQFGKAEKA